MAYDEAIKRKVRSAFVHKALSVKDSALLNNVPYNTARAWKKKAAEDGDDWDKAKAAVMMAEGGIGDVSQQILVELATQAQTVIDQMNEDQDMSASEKTQNLSKLADATSKTMAAVGKTSKQLSSLAVAMQVLKMLGEFVTAHFPEHGDAFVEILEPFAEKVNAELS